MYVILEDALARSAAAGSCLVDDWLLCVLPIWIGAVLGKLLFAATSLSSSSVDE
jgi:hypothetical protein